LHHAELKPDERAIEVGIDLMVRFIETGIKLQSL